MTTERSLPGVSPRLRARLRLLFRVLTWISPALAARVAVNILLTLARTPPWRRGRCLSRDRAQLRLRTPYGGVQAYEWNGDGPTVLIVHGWIRTAPLCQPDRRCGNAAA
jgi:hypothetical protein